MLLVEMLGSVLVWLVLVRSLEKKEKWGKLLMWDIVNVFVSI